MSDQRKATSWVVRPFRSTDREQLVALWGQVFPNDPPRNAPGSMIDHKLRVQPDLLLVVEIENHLVGALMAGFDGTRGWLHHLAVAPDYRRQGVATALVQTAEEGLACLGCPKVNLQVRAENAGVLAFYQVLGYGVEDMVSMGKMLP